MNSIYFIFKTKQSEPSWKLASHWTVNALFTLYYQHLLLVIGVAFINLHFYVRILQSLSNRAVFIFLHVGCCKLSLVESIGNLIIPTMRTSPPSTYLPSFGGKERNFEYTGCVIHIISVNSTNTHTPSKPSQYQSIHAAIDTDFCKTRFTSVIVGTSLSRRFVVIVVVGGPHFTTNCTTISTVSTQH